MKRVLVTVLVLGVMVSGAFAASNEVNSVNVVGFNRVSLDSNNWILVSAPFIQMGTSGIQDVFADQMVSGSSQGNADNVIFWDGASQSYIINWKHDAGWVEGAKLSTQEVFATRCFWVKSNTSSNQNVTMEGEVISSAVVTQTLHSGFSMVCYPFNASASVTNTALDALAVAGSSQGNADNIYKWDPVNQQYVIYWKHDMGWVQGAKLEDPTFDMGEGFWYVRRTNSVDWVETIPYTL